MKINSKLRFGVAATAMTAAFVAVIILINVAISVISNRTTWLDFDMTSSQNYTITAENEKWIKAIDKPVEIILTCTEDYYLTNYNTYIYTNNNYSDSTGGLYLKQTVSLLKDYTKINKNISLKFMDTSTPAFQEYYETYKSELTQLGDIIVESTFKNSTGKSQTKHKILAVDDLYTIDDTTGNAAYGSAPYYITASQVESSVTTALYYVTAEQTDKVTVINGYGTTDTNGLEKLLTYNNYDFDTINSLINENIPDETNIIVLAAPTGDMNDDELKKLDDFLAVKGHSLLYFASNTQPTLPNLEGLLNDWGISFGTGTLYETNSSYRSTNSGTKMLVNDADAGVVKNLNTNLTYYCSAMRPMSVAYEQKGSTYVAELIRTNDSVLVIPKGVDEDKWTDEGSGAKQSYSTMIFSQDVEGGKDDTVLKSCVLAVSSTDFYNDDYRQYKTIFNSDMLLAAVNQCAGRTEDSYTVENKEIDMAVFTANEITGNVAYWVCVWAIPIIVIAAGIIVFARRKFR